MARIIDGKAVSQKVWAETAQRVGVFEEARGRTPVLAVILTGEDPASKIYVRNKARACKACGIRSRVLRLPEETTQEELETEIIKLNADPEVDGILVQIPLPRHLDEASAIRKINPDKDVDGLHPVNMGRLCLGEEGFVSCTPQGVMRLLNEYGVEIAGKKAVVVGRSNIVGKPMALLLLQANATVTICHSRTKNLTEITRDADILVAAVGRADFITADMLKPGCVVVDVGINRVEKGIKGDVEEKGAEEIASLRTPVPGGVGPMTIAMLLSNTLRAAEIHG